MLIPKSQKRLNVTPCCSHLQSHMLYHYIDFLILDLLLTLPYPSDLNYLVVTYSNPCLLLTSAPLGFR